MILLRGLITPLFLERLPDILKENPNIVVAMYKKMMEVRSNTSIKIPNAESLDIYDIRICFGLTERVKAHKDGDTWIISDGNKNAEMNKAVSDLMGEDPDPDPDPEPEPVEEKPEENHKEKPEEATSKKKRKRNKKPRDEENSESSFCSSKSDTGVEYKTSTILTKYEKHLISQGAAPRAAAAKRNKLKAVLDLGPDKIRKGDMIEIDYQSLFREDGKDYWKSVIKDAMEVLK